ncbi:MAG: hypothetical protein KDB22_19245 [Planctomycetales bacterium]|nr:hypothetical protein [Planctomycetales bacterium]
MRKLLAMLAFLGLLCVLWTIAPLFASGPTLHDRIRIELMSQDGKKDDSVCSIAISADNKYLALAVKRPIVPSHGIYPYRIPPIRIRDLVRKEFVAEWMPDDARQFDSPETHIYHFEFSGDANRALVCWRPYNGTDLTIEILDCQTWKPIAKITHPLAEADVKNYVDRAFSDRHLNYAGSVFTFVSYGEDNDSRRVDSWRVHVRRTDRPDEDKLVVGFDPQSPPSLSPDGKKLLVRHANGVTMYDIETSEPERQVDHYLSNSDVWSPDSIHFALLDKKTRRSALVFTSHNEDAPKTMPGFAWVYCDHGNVLATTGGPAISLFSALSGAQIANLKVTSRKSVWTGDSSSPATMLTGGGALLCYLESESSDEFSYTALRFVDSRSGQILEQSLRLPESFASVKLSANNSYIVVDNDSEHTVDIWTNLPRASDSAR